MATRDEIIESTFAELDRHLRKASIAQVGGFRPPDDPLTSWFGGHFLALPDESWPENDHGPMLPLIQVRTDELPYKPNFLSDIAFFTVFIDCKELPVDAATNGDHWIIRTYKTLDGLTPITPPVESWLRPFPIKWSLTEDEGPQWDDAWGLHDLRPFNGLNDCINLFYDRYHQHSFTKIGGWPSYIQSGMYDPDRFVLQIGSEEKPRWMWGDNGNGYFYIDEKDEWILLWDCY